MGNGWSRATTVAVALVWIGGLAVGGAGTEARGQYSRRTPIVEAVEKTRGGIVTIKVEKKGAWSRKQTTASGVIVAERGYVVTNHHVIAGADRIVVRLFDDTELVAKVSVVDEQADLAVLQVKPDKPLQALPLGSGSDLMVGETVIAVGHPFGYTNTVSAGIISSVSRNVAMPGGSVMPDLIQVNASINPGNSGGPLLNINGELIGINVALREDAQGIAFAINADTVQQVLTRHLNAQKVAGVQHGLKCQEAAVPEAPTQARSAREGTPTQARSASAGTSRQRVLVKEVAGDGPAARAGLKEGDAILRVAGKAVANRWDVERALWDHQAGDHVELAVLRRGTEVQLDLTLQKGSDSDRLTAQK
jgi:serine protease Do